MRERVGAIIHKDKKILLVEETDIDHRSIPGGGIHDGETHQEAMHREMSEELGVIVTKMVFYHSFQGRNYFYGVDQIDHTYMVNYEGDFTVKSDIRGFGWFSKEDIEKKNINIPKDYRHTYIPQLITDGIL